MESYRRVIEDAFKELKGEVLNVAVLVVKTVNADATTSMQIITGADTGGNEDAEKQEILALLFDAAVTISTEDEMPDKSRLS
jgi:hypothetical protein